MENTSCYHCGNPCDSLLVVSHDKSFCCNGCKTVFEIFSERSSAVFGVSNPAEFEDPVLQNRLLSRYTALSQIANFNGGVSANQVALSLLRANS